MLEELMMILYKHFQNRENDKIHLNPFYEISITPPSPLRAFLFLPGSQRLVGLQAPLAHSPISQEQVGAGMQSQPLGERALGTKDLAGCTTAGRNAGAQLVPEIAPAWQPRLEESS